MTVPNTPIILTPADFADTGQWRLLIYVASHGMCAVLRHVADASRPAVQLFNEQWAPLEGRELLDKIENTIYEHPSVLDDYATEIVVETPHITWIPAHLAEDDVFLEEDIFHTVFPEPVKGKAELMTHRVAQLTALFFLTGGFDGFMARTLPGSKILSHLGVLAERLMPATVEGDALLPGAEVWVDLRASAMDMVVAREGKLLSTSVIQYDDAVQIPAAIVEALKRLGVWEAHPIINLNGADGCVGEAMAALTALGAAAVRMELPENVAASGLPLAAALLVFRE